MNKEAIIFTIDAGSSMDEIFIDSDSTRLKIALQCLKLTLQQKLFNNATHEIGFALFGQNDAQSDDGNSTLLHPISKPDLNFVRKIVELSDVKLGNDKPGGDIFEAIDFVVERLIDHCGTKKYNKRAFLFTNGQGTTKISKTRLDQTVSRIRQNDIKLNIIPMDFMETYDYEQNELDDEVFAHPLQAKNSQLLIEMRRICQQNIQIYPASLAIELYKKFRKKDTNPIALFKGQLQIALNLSIDVCSYKAIRKQRLKSLSKFDLTAPFDPQLRKEKDIQIDINYVIQGDTQIIAKENVMNAYNYGSNLVPMNEMFQNAAKIFEQKNFTLLGFVQSQKVPRHCFLGEVDIVVPQKENMISRKLFSAFIYSMLLQKKYAIARYVPRNMKRGVNPKLMVLIPYRSAQREMFYLTQLPTIEGVREYPFNSLTKSTEKQQKLVSDLVDKMMLVHTDEHGRQKQEVKIENMFNPYRQYFYQTIFYRALNDNQKDIIPELDQVTRNYITPERRIYADTDDELKRIKKEFRLKVTDIKKEKQNKIKTIVWKDLLCGELSMQTNFEEEEQGIAQGMGKKFTLDNEDDDKFNPNQPIVSFRKMINNNKKDLVNEALKDISDYIYKRNHKSNTEQQNLHLVQCAKEMRKGCIQQKEADFWDEWFSKVPKTLNENVYHLMKVSGLGFIMRSNEEVFRHDAEEMKPISQEIDDLD